MGNIATNINEQIEILKSRGMVLDINEEKAKQVLLDIGYYRLGFYWHPFEIDTEHNLKEGTKFSDVIKLYYLDVDLSTFLQIYTARNEVNFRTKVIYHVSNKYKKCSPVWFTDPLIVKPECIQELNNSIHELFN